MSATTKPVRVETEQVSKLTIFNAPKLDAISVIFQDYEPGRGDVIIVCYGRAWTCFWGAMGDGQRVADFFLTTDVDYIVNCLVRGMEPTLKKNKASELAYLSRIVNAIQMSLRYPHTVSFDPASDCEKTHHECEADKICVAAGCCMGA